MAEDDVVVKAATDSGVGTSFPANMTQKEFMELMTPIYEQDALQSVADLVGAVAYMVMRLGAPAADLLRYYVKWARDNRPPEGTDGIHTTQ